MSRKTLPLDSMRPGICHLSSANRTLDSRIFHLQASPTAECGTPVSFVGAHGFDQPREGVQLAAFRSPANRLARIAGAVRILRQALRTRADIFQLHDPELLPAGLILKALGRRVVYDACEDFPAMMETKRYLPRPLRSLVRRLVAGFEAFATARFDGLITADPWTLSRLSQTGSGRKLVFYNFPKVSLYPEPRQGESVYDFVYRGGLSERAGTWVLLEAMRLLAAEGRTPRLLIFGYADNAKVLEAFRSRVSAWGLEDLITLQGTVPHEQMAATLGQARIGLSPLLAIPKFERNIPVKVWEYWACGLAVIASDLRPIRPFLREGSTGLLVRPGDAAALQCAMGRLLDEPDLVQAMGVRGRRAVLERLHNRGEMKKLMRFYRQIAEDAA